MTDALLTEETISEENMKITIVYYKAPWCSECQRDDLKRCIEQLQTRWIYACFEWDIVVQETREEKPGAFPRIEFIRNGENVQNLCGSEQILQGLEMAMDIWCDM